MAADQEQDQINKRRLKALITATSDIVSIADAHGKIIPSMRTGDWQRFTGQSDEESAEMGWKSHVHPDDLNQMLSQLQKTAVSNEVLDLRYRAKRKDGDWRWLEGKIVPVVDDEGLVLEWISAVSDITDRKRAEEEKDALILQLQDREQALASSERGLRQLLGELEVANEYIKEKEYQVSAIFNNARGMIFSLDKQLRITAMNKAFVDIVWERTKVRTKEGDSIFLTIPDHEKENYQTIYQEVLNGQPHHRSKKWASGIYTEEFFEPIKDKNGLVLGIAIFSNNITERKLLEEQLVESLQQEKKLNEELAWREEELTTQEEELRSSYEQLSALHEQLKSSERKFEAISNSTNDAIYDWDIVHDRWNWSPGFRDLFGFDPVEPDFKIALWENSLTEDTKELAIQSLEHAFATGVDIWNEEYKLRQPNGKIVHVEERGQIIRDENGVPCRMVGGIRNVSEQKISHEELKKKSHFLNCVIDNMPIGIMLLDPEGNVSRANKTYVKTMGLPDDFVVTGQYNLQNDDLYLESDSKRFFEVAKKGGVVVNEELSLDFGSSNNKWSARTDKAWFSVTVFPVVENDQLEAIVVVSHEITANKIAQQKLQEKTQQIIETNKQMAEYRLMALRSVMNPHFLFNSLNSIQSFIATNEREHAINYLSLFSKLIRSVLNNSLDNSNTLSEELDILKLYMNLEKLRFEHPFTVQLEVSDDIDVESVAIPSLILQPFVENSILHGLYNKVGEDGRLLLSFQLQEERLLCIIEDNGVGRKASAQSKANNSYHKSVGMMLTRERIELMNKGDALSVKITDLYDAHQQPAGTRVEILIDMDN